MSEKLPTSVSLPQIREYTDDIVFGYLGLPSGFDTEQLNVNLRAIDRVRAAAGLGVVSITGVRGVTDAYDAQPTSINADGTALFGAVLKRQQKPLANGSVTFPSGDSSFGQANAAIDINITEIEQRIRDKHGISGQYNAKIQAGMLNSALKKGLTNANYDANVDLSKFKSSAWFYGFFGGLAMLVNDSFPVGYKVAYVLGAAPVFERLGLLRELLVRRVLSEEDIDVRGIYKSYRKSMFAGLALDRLVVANGITKASKLIKVDK